MELADNRDWRWELAMQYRRGSVVDGERSESSTNLLHLDTRSALQPAQVLFDVLPNISNIAKHKSGGVSVS